MHTCTAEPCPGSLVGTVPDPEFWSVHYLGEVITYSLFYSGRGHFAMLLS